MLLHSNRSKAARLCSSLTLYPTTGFRSVSRSLVHPAEEFWSSLSKLFSDVVLDPQLYSERELMKEGRGLSRKLRLMFMVEVARVVGREGQ